MLKTITVAQLGSFTGCNEMLTVTGIPPELQEKFMIGPVEPARLEAGHFIFEFEDGETVRASIDEFSHPDVLVIPGVHLFLSDQGNTTVQRLNA